MPPHRSFRLTPSDPKEGGSGVSLLPPLVQQAGFFIPAALMMDGGVFLYLVGYAAVAYWAGVAVILARRRRKLTRMDRAVIAVGFPMLVLLSYLLAQFIWALKVA